MMSSSRCHYFGLGNGGVGVVGSSSVVVDVVRRSENIVLLPVECCWMVVTR